MFLCYFFFKFWVSLIVFLTVFYVWYKSINKSVIFSPVVLVCRRVLTLLVFPTRTKQQHVSILQHNFSFSRKPEMFLFLLPQDQSAPFSLFLPASPLGPERRNQQRFLAASDCVCKMFSCFYDRVFSYQRTRSTHPSRTTRRALKHTHTQMESVMESVMEDLQVTSVSYLQPSSSRLPPRPRKTGSPLLEKFNITLFIFLVQK